MTNYQLNKRCAELLGFNTEKCIRVHGCDELFFYSESSPGNSLDFVNRWNDSGKLIDALLEANYGIEIEDDKVMVTFDRQVHPTKIVYGETKQAICKAFVEVMS